MHTRERRRARARAILFRHAYLRLALCVIRHREHRASAYRPRLFVCVPCVLVVFSILESVAFDTGYAGSNGLEPQSWVNGNGTSYIYFGSGEFDGQGSGHDFYGTLYMPPSGYVNSCDGGRSHTYCDYRQE